MLLCHLRFHPRLFYCSIVAGSVREQQHVVWIWEQGLVAALMARYNETSPPPQTGTRQPGMPTFMTDGPADRLEEGDVVNLPAAER